MTKPSNKEFSHIFDSAAAQYDGMTNNYAVSRRREFFLRYANGDCLEVGAGTGEMSRALERAGHSVMATDISAEMVAEIQKKGIMARVCDSEILPFPDASFDALISSEHIYYLDNPSQFIREAYRVLRPGGRLLISSANHTTRFYDRIRGVLRFFGFDKMYFDDQNRSFMTKTKIQKLIEERGFHIIRLEKTIVLPIGFLDRINRLLEKTFFKHLGVFIFVYAKKSSKPNRISLVSRQNDLFMV